MAILQKICKIKPPKLCIWPEHKRDVDCYECKLFGSTNNKTEDHSKQNKTSQMFGSMPLKDEF